MQSSLYSDRDDPTMVRTRKHEGLAPAVLAAPILAGLLALASYLVADVLSRLSPQFEVDRATLVSVVFLGTWAVSAPIFVLSWARAGRRGVEIVESSLMLFGKRIPISAIRRAAVVFFPNSTGGFGPALAIDYDGRRGKQERVRTVFVHKGATKDIFELGNSLRMLKGWSSQREALSCLWRDWKASRGKADAPEDVRGDS